MRNVNYLDKSSSTSFGILQTEMMEKDAFGGRKLLNIASRITSLDAIHGILVSNMPQIGRLFAVYCNPK